jgi:hypothetical protein
MVAVNVLEQHILAIGADEHDPPISQHETVSRTEHTGCITVTHFWTERDHPMFRVFNSIITDGVPLRVL